jgi:hypothetical protein
MTMEWQVSGDLNLNIVVSKLVRREQQAGFRV